MSPASYRTRLTKKDLDLLAAQTGAGVQALLLDDAAVEEALASPDVYEALFGAQPLEALVVASPFLCFAVLLERLRQDLAGTSFLSERAGLRQRVPVFDVAGPRDWLDVRRRRVFLADLLASYTRVAVETVWFRTGRGWRRRRFSDLSPLNLAELVELVPPDQRPGVLRRLGDLCLFLSGVFGDHVNQHPLEPRHLTRLARLLGGPESGGQFPEAMPSELVLAGGGGVWELDWVGQRAYRLAARQAGPDRSVLEEVADGFGRARRVLDALTREHLRLARSDWFQNPQSG
ncbi:MAG: hypothetical protein ACREQM_08620 [Candidatus Dormibacteraceae bacterium]